jgi:hypothetical protein
MNKLLSVSVSTCSSPRGWKKLGHPEPESNCASELKSGVPQQTQTYTPSSVLWTYFPVKGRSVPCFRAIWYCSGVNSAAHSWSVFSTRFAIFSILSQVHPEVCHMLTRTSEDLMARGPHGKKM